MQLSIAPLFSGSKGNCIMIGTEHTKVLVDAGRSCAQIEAELAKTGVPFSDIRGILITHEHSDHIAGVGVVSRKYDIPVFANELTWHEICKRQGEFSKKNIRVIDEHDFYINELCIEPFEVSHDAVHPFGYGVSHGGKKICVLTDLGWASDKVLDHARDANIVLLESNHDVDKLQRGPYPYPLKRRIMSPHGHLSNDAAAEAALKLAFAGVRGFLLGHLSEKNNEYELARDTVCGYLAQNGVIAGKHVAVALARREGMTGQYVAK